MGMRKPKERKFPQSALHGECLYNFIDRIGLNFL